MTDSTDDKHRTGVEGECPPCPEGKFDTAIKVALFGVGILGIYWVVSGMGQWVYKNTGSGSLKGY